MDHWSCSGRSVGRIVGGLAELRFGSVGCCNRALELEGLDQVLCSLLFPMWWDSHRLRRLGSLLRLMGLTLLVLVRVMIQTLVVCRC